MDVIYQSLLWNSHQIDLVGLDRGLLLMYKDSCDEGDWSLPYKVYCVLILTVVPYG